MNTIREVDTRPRLWRSRWAAIGAAVAVTLGAGGLITVNAAEGPPSSVVTIDPIRILDTRNNIGLSGPFQSRVPRKLLVTNSDLTGALLNVTVVAPTANGFLSVRPGDATGTPSTSSMNFVAGDIVSNSVQVGLPTSGRNKAQIEITFDAYGVSGPTTHVLVDVVGYMFEGEGAPGPIGPAGTDGTDGEDGAPGADGAPGVDGEDGAPGVDGEDGAPGVDGEDGAPGVDGEDGAPGVDGEDGAPGVDGEDGTPGAVGPQGPAGIAGLRTIESTIAGVADGTAAVGLTPECASNEVAISAGIANGFGADKQRIDNFSVAEIHPFSARRWSVSFANGTGVSTDVTLYTVCAATSP